MPTLAQLEERGALHKLDPQLGPREQEDRLIYASPKFVKWVVDELPNLGSTWKLEDSPEEQLFALFLEFARGDVMTYGHQFKRLYQRPGNTWELKTADLRIFGWFVHRDCFVAVVANTAEFVKEHNLYRGYVGEVVRFRDALQLDLPKSIDGEDPHAVLSNYDCSA